MCTCSTSVLICWSDQQSVQAQALSRPVAHTVVGCVQPDVVTSGCLLYGSGLPDCSSAVSDLVCELVNRSC
jgi:hypothetical protein